MSFLERKRQAEFLAAESNGVNVWNSDFPMEFRRKVIYLMNESTNSNSLIFDQTRYLILRGAGWQYLSVPNLRPKDDFISFVENSNSDILPEAFERFYETLSDHSIQSRFSVYGKAREFESKLRDLLLLDRINWDFINGMMIPRDSQFMHSQLIMPTLVLLNQAKFAQTESIIQKGLKEISVNDAGDAITDFGTATQSFLLLIGAKGSNLGELKSSALGKNLINNTQAKIVDAIAMYRNAGEAHNVDNYSVKDAWLVCHLVCALINHIAN